MGGFPELFLERVGKPLGRGVLLKDVSNFRIGGPADFFFEAGTESDLRAALGAARKAASGAMSWAAASTSSSTTPAIGGC
jgi:hypothetical protein